MHSIWHISEIVAVTTQGLTEIQQIPDAAQPKNVQSRMNSAGMFEDIVIPRLHPISSGPPM